MKVSLQNPEAYGWKSKAMAYTWLKSFHIDIAEAYPYFKIRLEISPPREWGHPAPFYTFAVGLKTQNLDFGWYLYVGDLVDSVLESDKEFVVNANLRLIDIHALSNKSRWIDTAHREEYLMIEAEALVYLLNYQSRIATSSRIQSPKILEWISREENLRNDFVPLPSPPTPQEITNAVAIANVALLYKRFFKLREEIKSLISEKLIKIEPLITIFEHGFENYKKALEEEIKRKYEIAEFIINLVKSLKAISSDTLDENWALSTLVLAALENVVNIKLKELEESTSGDFKTRASRLKKALVTKNKWNEREASDLARSLRGKYEERNMIIHGGFENPTTKEAALNDLKFIENIIEKLFKIPYKTTSNKI